MVDVNGFKITVRQSLITFKQTLFGPGASTKAILVIICSTSCCVTSLMLNWSLRGIKSCHNWNCLSLYEFLLLCFVQQSRIIR